MSIKELTNKIIADGKITPEEYQSFQDAINADGKVDAEENEQILRLFQLIQDGKVEVL